MATTEIDGTIIHMDGHVASISQFPVLSEMCAGSPNHLRLDSIQLQATGHTDGAVTQISNDFPVSVTSTKVFLPF